MIIRRRTYNTLRARIRAYQAQVNDYHQRIDADRVRQSTAIVRGVRLSARLDRMVRARRAESRTPRTMAVDCLTRSASMRWW